MREAGGIRPSSHRGLLVLLLVLACSAACAAQSVCYGTTANGRLDGGVKLPPDGRNFVSYSGLAATLGRTHVHSKVRDIVVAAYAKLQQTLPGTVFVYGETGWASGGRFRPHRTHQNGLSVDFFVPVRDGAGRSVPLPTRALERFGYDLEFDARGRLDELRIDFEALAEHLYQLHVSAREAGAGIALVILDPPYLPRLFATRRGDFLQANVPFMTGHAWVRHDEHYHVDFRIPCRPMPAG